jgi:hypothetical protein
MLESYRFIVSVTGFNLPEKSVVKFCERLRFV